MNGGKRLCRWVNANEQPKLRSRVEVVCGSMYESGMRGRERVGGHGCRVCLSWVRSWVCETRYKVQAGTWTGKFQWGGVNTGRWPSNRVPALPYTITYNKHIHAKTHHKRRCSTTPHQKKGDECNRNLSKYLQSVSSTPMMRPQGKIYSSKLIITRFVRYLQKDSYCILSRPA